jgi:RimJ/RimL family protein N-acetyltransferase
LRHDLHLSGHAFRLRPVEDADAAFIVDLRTRFGRFLNRGASSSTEQLAWLDAYFDRTDDFYFVVESIHDGRPEGLIGLYDIDPVHSTAEWGRWVLAPGSNASIESALLIYRCAFVVLSLERVWCRTLAENVKGVSFQDSCGLERARGPVSILHNGELCPAIEHVLSRERWPLVMERLDGLAARFARAQRRHSSPGVQ